MKKMKQRIFALLLVLVCAFAIAGCAAATPATDDTAKSVQEGVTTFVTDLCGRASSIDGLLETYKEGSENANSVYYNGILSFQNALQESGDYVSYDAGDVFYDESAGTYEAHGMVHFTNRNCEYVMVVTSTNDVTSISFTPEYSLGEKMSKAGMNTLMGMGIVFVILILISLLISCFKFINIWETKHAAKKAAKENSNTPAATVTEINTDACNDLELVAVITAAIAAAEGTSGDELVVRSIRRVSETNKWRKA